MIRLGFVTATDDPEALGRVKLEYLGHEAGAESDWALIVTPLAGDQTGFFTMPEVGDMVAVAFINDDLNAPLMLGALWNGAQKPPSDKPTERMFISRKGHAITLSDGDDDGIILKDTHGNTITLNKDGITIVTEKDLKITVGGETTFETTGEATIKGAPIQLNP